MPQPLPLHEELSQASSFDKEYLTKSAEFEDGYGQYMPAGINASRWTGKAVYEGVTVAKLATILAALDAVGGWDFLTYDPIDFDGQSNPVKFRVASKVTINWISGVHANVSFDLRQGR